MRHSYTVGCDCRRCVRELERRNRQANADPRRILTARRNWNKGRVREKVASREEQHASYLDSGHNDDLGESPDY